MGMSKRFILSEYAMGLDSVELVMEAERLFNIEISDVQAENIFTFGQFVDCVCEISWSMDRRIERLEIETSLRKMVSQFLAVDVDSINLDSRFIEDLGMN